MTRLGIRFARGFAPLVDSLRFGRAASRPGVGLTLGGFSGFALR